MEPNDIQPETPKSVATISELLARPLPDDYVREWTARVAAAHTAVVEGTRSVMLFRIGEEWLALPTVAIREVAEPVPIHHIPHRAGAVLGIAGVRGELLLCLSLGAVLELPEVSVASATTDARARLLVAETGGGPLAFPVDEVHGVQRYDPRDLRDAPATLTHAPAVYTMGLLPWRDTTVGCLDADLLFYRLNKSLA